MKYLPLEVVIIIFSKATLKTLLQCRRVCKSWRAALSDPSTIKASIKLPKCLVIHGNPNDTSNSRFIHLYDQRTIPSPDNAILKLDTKVNDPKSVAIELVGSCNGLLCWCRKEPAGEKGLFHFTLYISNPLTGEFMTITGGTEHIERRVGSSYYHNSERQLKVGFGYAPKKKQHKLVFLSEKKKGGTYEAKVLTLTTTQGNGKWKCLECPYRVQPRFGVHADGALHWIANGIDREYISETKCSFGLDTEQFKLLPSPPTTGSYTSFKLSFPC